MEAGGWSGSEAALSREPYSCHGGTLVMSIGVFGSPTMWMASAGILGSGARLHSRGGRGFT